VTFLTYLALKQVVQPGSEQCDLLPENSANLK
jgi:hypothetical protein